MGCAHCVWVGRFLGILGTFHFPYVLNHQTFESSFCPGWNLSTHCGVVPQVCVPSESPSVKSLLRLWAGAASVLLKKDSVNKYKVAMINASFSQCWAAAEKSVHTHEKVFSTRILDVMIQDPTLLFVSCLISLTGMRFLSPVLSCASCALSRIYLIQPSWRITCKNSS